MISKNALVAGLLLMTPLVGQAQRHVAPQITDLLKVPLKQTKVTDCAAAVREVQWGSTRLTYTSDGLRFDGLQSSGAAWHATVPASNVLKCEVWSANLHKGAKSSLIVFKAPETGGIEGGELTIFSFDDQGRPLPWQVTGSLTSTAQGITQLASDPATETAQILVPVREGDPHSDFAEVTSLFRWQNGGLSKVVGTDSSGAKWPVVSGSTRALTGKESLLTSSFGKTDATAAAAALASAEPVKVVKRAGFSDAEPVLLSNGQRSRFPAMLVLDKADGSRSIFLDEHVVDGIDEVIQLGSAVTLQEQAARATNAAPSS